MCQRSLFRLFVIPGETPGSKSWVDRWPPASIIAIFMSFSRRVRLVNRKRERVLIRDLRPPVYHSVHSLDTRMLTRRIFTVTLNIFYDIVIKWKLTPIWRHPRCPSAWTSGVRKDWIMFPRWVDAEHVKIFFNKNLVLVAFFGQLLRTFLVVP